MLIAWYKFVPFPTLRLALERDQVSRVAHRDVARLRAQAKFHEIEEREARTIFHLKEIDEEITFRTQRKLFRQAARLLVPTPGLDETECWKKTDITGRNLVGSRNGVGIVHYRHYRSLDGPSGRRAQVSSAAPP